MVELTPEGRAWAQEAEAQPVPSMIAIVALQHDKFGDESTWPEAHRRTAVEEANELGARHAQQT